MHDRAERLYRELVPRLLAQRRADGRGWRGRLSSSALATAVACIAYRVCACQNERRQQGLDWLEHHQNQDGGWGDTPASPSNISTTLLAWSALAERGDGAGAQRAESCIRLQVGSLEPQDIVDHIEARYGTDRTFAVPILAACALAGRFGSGAQAFAPVRQLPLELAALPQAAFRLIRMPVVSYALPALIAIGLLAHRRRPGLQVLRWLRAMLAAVCLRRLERMQPSSGGFLEATPLTAFVAMSLYGAGERRHPVVQQGLHFLNTSQRDDGSWPIDSDLANWVTNLAISACQPSDIPDQDQLLAHLREQQSSNVHPFTGAAAGAWAWTDLPGGVPDADDTSAALLALHTLDPQRSDAARRGLQWLIGVQNGDGGIPTFCRGWGHLPFDSSSPDITAHALRAIDAWRETVGPMPGLHACRRDCLRYLLRCQRDDGSWIPLWFGNQQHPHHHNPVYGTSRVLLALRGLEHADPAITHATERATACLRRLQLADGSWGSIEESALALQALAHDPGSITACTRGLACLEKAWRQPPPPAPIGLYFASLWYDEALYPLIFTLAACRALA